MSKTIKTVAPERKDDIDARLCEYLTQQQIDAYHEATRVGFITQPRTTGPVQPLYTAWWQRCKVLCRPCVAIQLRDTLSTVSVSLLTMNVSPSAPARTTFMFSSEAQREVREAAATLGYDMRKPVIVGSERIELPAVPVRMAPSYASLLCRIARQPAAIVAHAPATRRRGVA